jgi:hypothetical protein
VTDRPDLRNLVGDDVAEPELDRLRRADELLRAVPLPPEVPESLTRSVLAIPGRVRGPSRRWLLAAAGIAAALAAATFGIGVWAGGGSEETALDETVTLSATPAAPPAAEMVLYVLPKDDAGNWPMAADVTGLPPLPKDGYYELWLTKGQELVASCGRFVVGADGSAESVWLNGPYRFTEYDRWVVVSWAPNEGMSEWLLDGPVAAPA